MSKKKVELSKLETVVAAVAGFTSAHKKKVIGIVIGVILISCGAISFAVYYDMHQQDAIVAYEQILTKYSELLKEKKEDEAYKYATSEIIKLTESTNWGYIKDNGYYLVAGVFFHNKKYSEALEYYGKFVQNTRKSDLLPLAKIQMAVCHEWLGNNDQAFKQYTVLEEELKDTKFNEQVLYDLGRHYQIQGDIKKAKEYYSRILSEYAGSFYEKQAKKRLMLINYVASPEK